MGDVPGEYVDAMSRKWKRAHLGSLGDLKHKEDVKIPSQLPDYDDFRGYDLGVGGILSQVARGIYADFHKPSWET